MVDRSRPYKILIVDDAPAVREALRWAFEDLADFVVVGEADNGLQAIEQATEISPDVVILDIELPKLDGYGVARTLKTLPKAPIIIFLTVHNDANTKRRCKEVGGDGFVPKGSGWTALIAQIQNVLSNC